MVRFPCVIKHGGYVEGNTLECSRKLATVRGDAGKSNHREVFAGPGAIKLKRSQDWGDMKLCFSGPSKLDHYCMAYPNLGP